MKNVLKSLVESILLEDPLTSSFIQNIRFDGKKIYITIEGIEYWYRGDENTYNELKNSRSLGEFYNIFLKLK